MLRPRREEIKQLVKANPILEKYYGISTQVSRDLIDFAYCPICQYYFTKHVKNKRVCPICHTTLRHNSRSRPKRIDPEKYGVEV